MSDASVAVCAASPAGHGVGGVVQLSRGERGGRGVGGGESAGFAGQRQLPQGVQGVHLGSAQQIALALRHTETPRASFTPGNKIQAQWTFGADYSPSVPSRP